MAEIRLHNTLTGKVEPFVPQRAGEVKMYTCGPTVYDYAHIGNFRTFVFQDILRRFLKLRGFKLNHVDEFDRCGRPHHRERSGGGSRAFASTRKNMRRRFSTDCKTLSIEAPEHWIRATDHIDDMVQADRAAAGESVTRTTSDGSIYYRIAKFPEYGKLSKIDVTGIQAGARVDNDRYEKESARDFALWKAPKAGRAFLGNADRAGAVRAGTSNAPRWP